MTSNTVYSSVEQITPNCYGIIYCTINLINGKIYVGSKLFTNYRPYLNKFYLGSNIALKRSVLKYGDKNFIRKIIKELQPDDNLKYWEEYYLNILNCAKSSSCYNFCNNYFGGDTFSDRSEKDKSITKEKLRINSLKLNTVANLNTLEVLEKHKQRMFYNNPSKIRSKDDMMFSSPQRKEVIIVFEKDNIELKFPGIKAAARSLNFSEQTFKTRYRLSKNVMKNGWLIKDQ